MATDRTQRGLQDIPPAHVNLPLLFITGSADDVQFPIWSETLGYERGMAHFREPPEFAEEGVLEMVGQQYTYTRIRRRVAPQMRASTRLSATGHVELEDGSPPPSQNEDETGDSSSLASLQQTTWAPAQSTSSFYDVDNSFNPLHYYPVVFREGSHYIVYSAELSPMEGIEWQTYPRYNMPGSTSALHPMQWDSPSPVSTYGQPLGHDGPMTSPQPDGQMTELVPTPPYDTNNASGDLWHV